MSNLIHLDNKIDELVFVYGTLKEGRGNHSVLGDSELISQGLTRSEYYLTDVGFPYLHDMDEPPTQGQPKLKVLGEVYRVTSPSVMRGLDLLEGHSESREYNHYEKKKINIISDIDYMCWVYYVDTPHGRSYDHMVKYDETLGGYYEF